MKEENIVINVTLRISEKIKKVSQEEGKHALDQTTAESH